MSRLQFYVGVASVAGLAPARTGLKGQLRELLCIHGLEGLNVAGVAGCKLTDAFAGKTCTLQLVTCNASAPPLARLVGKQWP
jgi:hypothetical protein